MNAHKDKILLAVLCCISAHFLFAVMGACAKILSENHHVAEVAFFRNLLVLIPFFLYIVLRKKNHLFKTDKPKLVGFRAVLGAVSLMVTFGALSLLPMSYAAVIFFTSTILTPVLAFFFLKEHIGIHRWSAVVIGMCGVLVICQPSGSISMLGVSLGLLAATFHAVMYIVLRSLKTESTVTITFYFMLGGTVIPALALPWVYSPIAFDELWIFALIALSGGMAQFALSNAYKYAPASLVTPFSYSALLWTIGLDLLFWGYDLDFWSVFIGASLIIGAQSYIAYREYINRSKSGGTPC